MPQFPNSIIQDLSFEGGWFTLSLATELGSLFCRDLGWIFLKKCLSFNVGFYMSSAVASKVRKWRGKWLNIVSYHWMVADCFVHAWESSVGLVWEKTSVGEEWSAVWETHFCVGFCVEIINLSGKPLRLCWYKELQRKKNCSYLKPLCLWTLITITLLQINFVLKRNNCLFRVKDPHTC